MDLDRGALARIDRKVLSSLSHDESWQMVRVPVSEAVWSAWKRYCAALGISMGRAISALMTHELRSVVDEIDGQPVFLAQRERGFAEGQQALDARETGDREQRLRTVSRMRHDLVMPQPMSRVTKVVRNDPCPYGSGLKFRGCHDR
jgi:hypothetical protein